MVKRGKNILKSKKRQVAQLMDIANPKWQFVRQKEVDDFCE